MERSDDHQRAQRATHLMRWRIGLGEDRGLGGSQVESVRAVASSPPTHPCYSLPFRATDPNWVWSSDWQAGQTITWTTDEANLFTRTKYTLTS